jgi:hypothetical protein
VATPIYATRWAGGTPWGSSSTQRTGAMQRLGSWFSGTTPLYCGPGQPMPGAGSSITRRAPAYRSAPPPVTIVPPDVATAPQPSSVAIVVPRT